MKGESIIYRIGVVSGILAYDVWYYFGLLYHNLLSDMHLLRSFVPHINVTETVYLTETNTQKEGEI